MAVVNTAATDNFGGFFDQLGQRLAQQRQATSVATTLAPYLQGGAVQQPPPQTADGSPPQSSLPAIAAQQGAPSSPGLTNLFANATSQYGLPQGYLPRLAAIESKFDPNAISPTGAAGPYQFTKSTAAQYNLTNPTDWAASTDAAARLTVANRAALTSALGRDPTPGELYLSHQQGAQGAISLLSNPNARAGDVVGDQAVRVNGGDPNMPAGAFANMWTSKFGGGGAPVQVAGGNTTPPSWYHPTRQPDPKPGAQVAAAPQASTDDEEDAPAASAPVAPAAPAQPVGLTQAASVARGGGVTPDMLRALLSNPDTMDLGKQLWAQTLTGKSFNFMQTSDGSIVRVDPSQGTASIVYHGPTKGVVVNKSLVDPVSGRVIYGGEKDDPKYDYKEINGHLIAANAADAGDVKDVTPSGIPAGYRPATPEERQSYGASPNTPLIIGPDGKPSTISNGVTVNLGDKANGGLDSKIVDDIAVGKDKAIAASNTIQAIGRMGQALDSGQMITGSGAGQRLAIRNALATVLGIDDPAVINSQNFEAAANTKAAQIARQISVTGHTTNADLNMAKIISGSDLTYSATALREIARQQQVLAQDEIQRHNASVDKFSAIMPDAAQRAGYFKVPMPAPYDFGQDKNQQATPTDPLSAARAAISRGAPRDAVIKRLKDNGIDASGL